MSFDKARVFSSLVIGICLVAVAVILAASWRKTHVSHQSVSVTGHGQKDFKSDLIVWKAYFTRQGVSLSDANGQLRNDVSAIRKFLQENGVGENEISFSTLKVNRDYATRYNQEGNVVGSEFKGFVLAQEITVESRDLAKVEKMMTALSDLIEKGIEISSQEPDYYYTKLQDLKIELLRQATADGLDRARTITENAGSGVGKLINAGMGVFQITGQNSNEDYSWGGSFNTKAKDKTASITVKLEFEL